MHGFSFYFSFIFETLNKKFNVKQQLLIATLVVTGFINVNNSKIELSISADKNEELFVKDVNVSIINHMIGWLFLMMWKVFFG